MAGQSFLGRGWRFPPEFEKDNTPTLTVSDERDIVQSLRILLGTEPGERVHRYDYGCPLRKYMFETLDTTTQTLMREEISRAIILFEPRITLEGVDFTLYPQRGMMAITIEYTIRYTNRRSNMVYPFYLNEGTEITE